MKKTLTYITLLLMCFNLQVHSVSAIPKEKSTNILSAQITSNLTSRKYILGPNDVFSIYILNSPEFNQEKIRVQPDGKIIHSLLGSIQVSGLTIDQLNDLLEKELKFYLKNPQTTIKFEESRPFIIYVKGSVANPGGYELSTDTSTKSYQSLNPNKLEVQIDRKTPLLSNVLVAAGGVLFDADIEHVRIANSYDNSKFEVNLLKLLEENSKNQDIYLMPGDNVYIPKLPTPLAVNEDVYKKFASSTFSPKFVPVKVYGYVNTPGLVKLDPSQSLNLSSAIVMAGGYQSNAAYAPTKIYVSRADVSGKFVTTVVNPRTNDITLMPNDNIYVPEKTRPLIGKAFDFMTRIAYPFNVFADSYNNWGLMFDPHRYQVIGK